MKPLRLLAPVALFFGLAVGAPAAYHFLQPSLTPIPRVQGEGDASPLVDRIVTVEGVVVGAFQGPRQLSGFYLQDPRGDGDERTSDGVFVYVHPSSPFANTPISEGHVARVTGRVEEFRGQTQIGRISSLSTRGSAPLPAPVSLRLPLPEGVSFSRYEGMLVRFDEPVIVTAQNDLERFGSLLVADERLLVPTNHMRLEELPQGTEPVRTLVLDDGSNEQNPSPTPYLDENGTRRTGDAIVGLTGIMSFGFDAYRLQPTRPVVFEARNPRPSAPQVEGDLSVASVNLYNWFTTFKNANSNARGSDNAVMFERQAQKIVALFRGLDADIVGLQELENNDSSLPELVTRLNAAYGRREYAFVPDPATGVGTDAIKLGFIYKPERVSLNGPALSRPDPVFERFPVGQSFRAPNGQLVAVVTNHFKSKRCGDETPEEQRDRGEGCFGERRVRQAESLATFVGELQSQSGDGDVLVLGDLNSYAKETPLLRLREIGLEHLNLRVPPEERYSFSFNGRFGSLDHILATPSLVPQISEFKKWHINADEPFWLGYNRVSVARFQPNEFRSSDHDPVLIGLRLGGR